MNQLTKPFKACLSHTNKHILNKPSLSKWGGFSGQEGLYKITSNIESLSLGYPLPSNYLVDKINKTLPLSSICKFWEHTTLQHIALMSAEKLQAEECFLTTAGWKKYCGQGFRNNHVKIASFGSETGVGCFSFFWRGGGLVGVFLSREGERERRKTFKLGVYLNIILLGLLQILLVFPMQCG